MGHVLGTGTYWQANGLYSGSGDDYVGGDLRTETDGGASTAGGHWDEACLDQELITGSLDTKNQISKLTMGTLEDIGYGADYSTADLFDLLDLSSSGCVGYCSQVTSTRRLCSRPKLSNDGQHKMKMHDAQETKIIFEGSFQTLLQGWEYIRKDFHLGIL
jgi:hypothetical protein